MDIGELERLLKENAHECLGIFFDEDENVFCAVCYVDGKGDLEGQGETLAEAILNLDKQWKLK